MTKIDAQFITSELGVGQPLSYGLAQYVRLLLEWNRRINLTAARTPEAVVREHLRDSLAVLQVIPGEARVAVDVGSGGGFPGIVVALARPELSLTLLEPVHKKQAFLAATLRELGADNARAVPLRLEDYLSDREHRGAADVAMSRATWPVLSWLERGQSLVRPGGIVLAFEGREQVALPVGACRHPAPRGDRVRSIIELRR